MSVAIVDGHCSLVLICSPTVSFDWSSSIAPYRQQRGQVRVRRRRSHHLWPRLLQRPLRMCSCHHWNEHILQFVVYSYNNVVRRGRDLNCTQSGVPAFNGYRSLIGSTKEVEMVLTSMKWSRVTISLATGDLHVNSVAYYKISEEGMACSKKRNE